MISGNRGNHILELKETPFSIAEGRFLMSRRALLASKKHPLYLQTIVLTPLSIRRGVGGEAVVGDGGEALLTIRTLLLHLYL